MSAAPLPPILACPARARPPRITRLILQDFRTYPALDLAFEHRVVALAGENGAGKTNLLEALSLFGPGRGLRRAELAEMARSRGPGSFSASILVDTAYGEHRLGTGLEAAPARAGRAASAASTARRRPRPPPSRNTCASSG